MNTDGHYFLSTGPSNKTQGNTLSIQSQMLPNATFDNDSGIYTFTLWRDEKQVIHELKGVNVFVDAMPDKAKDDGNSYFIYVQPYQGEDFEISLSKEEFDILDPMLMDIEEAIYQKSCEGDSDSDSHDAYRDHPLDHE